MQRKLGKSNLEVSRSLARLILTDVQFWLPVAILIVGVVLVIFLDKR